MDASARHNKALYEREIRESIKRMGKYNIEKKQGIKSPMVPFWLKIFFIVVSPVIWLQEKLKKVLERTRKT
jgi:hypothetical protein